MNDSNESDQSIDEYGIKKKVFKFMSNTLGI